MHATGGWKNKRNACALSHSFDTCNVRVQARMNAADKISLQRDAEAIRTVLYLGVALTITWIIGAAGLSLAWLVLVLALVATVVKARVSRLLQTELQHELARLRRRRALYKDETAEWLSLLLNKWQVPFSAAIDDPVPRKLIVRRGHLVRAFNA